MNDRTTRLRERSLTTPPSISAERAQLVTRFHATGVDEFSPPLRRALAFGYICERKSISIGADELIVGDRGPRPRAVSTFPELTCHSLDDLRILDKREKTAYAVDDEVLEAYRTEIIPFWQGRSLRDRIFEGLEPAWQAAYAAGLFTEFMEQRAPGHTVGDGKLYRKGMFDFSADVARSRARWEASDDPSAAERLDELAAMDIAAEAITVLADRHAAEARRLAATAEPVRRAELERIADVCERVPRHAPRDFHEALQMYWFCHLGVITELNGWDAFSPGHLDQHLEPFYRQGLADGSLTRERARELLECFFIKFNDHPAPPKVGVTAAESGTYTDFAAIDMAGVLSDGRDGVGEVSYLLLEVIGDLHLVQPSPNIQVSSVTPDAFIDAAARVIRRGYGYPSVFNADAVVAELTRMGKSVEDAREGGTSGCVEAGAFGKEAYILTGYINLPKILEVALSDGIDPATGTRLGPSNGGSFASFDDVFDAWRRQLQHTLDIKLRGNDHIEAIYAAEMPAPFLSLITDDCIEKGLDYNAGGARYNTSFVQGVGIGTLTDSLAALKYHVYDIGDVSMSELLAALRDDFAGQGRLRLALRNRSPKWGNDDDAADDLMRRAFEAFVDAVDGRPNGRGGRYGVDMLPTTCHVYFGEVTGATPDGRAAGAPLSEGISPSHGMDRLGPTAVLRSAAKMDHERTCGTLLNMKLSPGLVDGDAGIMTVRHLIRTYFGLGGHHIQFNVVSADALREAQANPDAHRDLIVRVAGYSDYFCDISRALQDEIIQRTEHQAA
jgi:trans-4-hydroxy-L-proline dehydratase